MLDRRSVMAASAATVAPRAGREDAFDRLFLDQLQAKGVPGGSLAVVRAGKVVKLRGYGLAEVETGRKADEGSVFVMASASKFFTGLTAMQLVEAGKLDLEAPAADYLPELKLHAEVKVWQMLSHTSGLAPLSDSVPYNAEYAKRDKAGQWADPRKLELFTPAEMIAAGVVLPARERPGTVWRYNQYPIFLFGQIVERLAGQPFERRVQETIFEPLGMKSAAYGDYRSLVPGRRSNAYSRDTGVLQNYPMKYSPSFWPAAGCNASAGDMARLLLGLEPGRLLSAQSIARIGRNVGVPRADGADSEYGIASTAIVTNGRAWIGHEGGGVCYFGWWPKERLGVAALFNLQGSRQDGIERKIAALALD